ncbi:solute carrier family 7 member 13-like [Peromyscus leucopus]|uniref:solute carrier family 7 member 13-like n=1 Tax=Peromyscus leucopus TaxID=10041 RepID=UPI0010A15951|nr:solute carrier family 7 member 13-like [Peromyscus leucopus]
MQLLRAIGFFRGNMFLFSAVIGAGIFVSPKGALEYSSLNIPVSLSIWVVCAVLSMINALCLAELGTTFPVSAAPYYFMKRSLGSSVAFLSLWIKLFAYPLGLGAQSLLIAGYLIQPFYVGCLAPELPKKCLALAVLWSLGILNAQGVTTVFWFNTISSLIKMGVLCLIILTGIVLLVIGKRENVSRFENALDADLPDASQIVEAILQVFYAYMGSSLLVNIAGEIKNPSETIPKSLISSLPVIAVLYVLTNVSYLTVLTPQEIIASESVAVTWMNGVFPSMQWIISLGISISLLNTTVCGILTASRNFYSASQEGQLPFIYAMLNDHHCPVVAVTQIIILSSVAILFLNVTYTIKYIGQVYTFMNALNIMALLKLRYKEPDLPRPYKVWLPFVFGTIALSLFLLFMPIIKSPTLDHLYEVIIFCAGLPCYWLHILLKKHVGVFDKITCYLQLLFNVSPLEDQDKSFSAEEN